MDVGLVNPILAAIADILSKISGITLNVGKPFLKTSPEGDGAISGIVTLKGDQTGTAGITFSKECILAVVSKMFGEAITDVDNDVKDAVGEITNMICGLATQLYEKEGIAIKASLDQVLMDDRHVIPHLPEQPVLGIPISTDAGALVVELCYKEP